MQPLPWLCWNEFVVQGNILSFCSRVGLPFLGNEQIAANVKSVNHDSI